jgi:dTDP-4-dehydrorhamnose 3,5-epimerase
MLKGIKIFKNSIFYDKRGYIWTSWKKSNKKFKKLKFIHDKFSISKKNVLRGFHWDKKTWKLISCVYGRIFFVVLNCNRNSKSYLKHNNFFLDHKKNSQILVPPSFANAMLCLSDKCVLHYKLSYRGDYNDSEKQFSIKWNDPKIKVKWPINKNFILSERDK